MYHLILSPDFLPNFLTDFLHDFSTFKLYHTSTNSFTFQAEAVVEGLAKVIPVPLLSLFTGDELRTMVCGQPEIPLDMLKSVAVYKGSRPFNK